MKEDCGVIAVYRKNKNSVETTHRGLFALQHRGQEAAGICALTDGKIRYIKGRGLVSEALPIHKIEKLQSQKSIGHVRYSTVDFDNSENIQPFIAKTPYGNMAIAHNGNLKNAKDLITMIEGSGALLSTDMDTELLAHLIARSKAKTLPEALYFMSLYARGAYSLTMICDGRLYGFRDEHGIRPLVLGQLEDGWVIASETCALDVIGADYIREIEPCELVEIGEQGVISTQMRPAGDLKPCVFELVYFARPDSLVFGQSAYRSRIRMGEELADQDGHLDADIVVPVPDSGVPAAVGYARRSKIPFEKAIVRSHFIGRTFILPDQDTRANSLKLKLSIIKEAVVDKKIVLIDDSIVRGNTSKMIVSMLREAGAREVRLRVASPPLPYPCYFGIDTPTYEELIVNKHDDLEGVCKFLGADDLKYLSLEGLKRATKNQSFCFGCMDGKYPIK